MELEFIKWLASHARTHANVPLGIGDDAALLEMPADRQVVVTTDMLTELVHFDLREHSAERVGRKALAANLSDLAAMAAEPDAAFVSINLPRGNTAATLARDLMIGIERLADEYDCVIAGGDTNVTAGPLVISVTAIGWVESGRAWLRSGAQPGDRLLVSGKLGGSLLGRHLDFTPRVREASELAGRYDIHAAIDLSDGLALDLSRMIAASGVGAVVDVAHIPITPDAVTQAEQSGQTPLAHALGDGEDFELLLAVPPDVSTVLLETQPIDCGLTDVGEIVADRGLYQRTADGQIVPLEASGYQHE